MMHVPLAFIQRRYQHLYYQDGPVDITHLVPHIAEKARKAKCKVHLIGLASTKPRLDLGAKFTQQLNRES